ncbi:MAG: phospho-sugar mutase [Candidatus Auribacterota bacterium]
MDTVIQARIKEWLSDDYDTQTREEIQRLIDSGNEKELVDRFYTELDFGTGGLRGIIGTGTNRINKYIVAQVTQGLASYILKQGADAAKKGVAIAYDSRYKSPEFALEAALVLAGNGIKVYLCSELRPTPFLSFCVRELGTISGIVITASHNPKEYNGYKVYWDDGGQVVPPHDKNIITEVKKVTSIKQVRKISREDAEKKKLLVMLGPNMDEKYLSQAEKLCINPSVISKVTDSLKIVFTPIHGTGVTLIPPLLKRLGFKNVHVVEQQKTPDPAFSTVASPNPEETAAMELALKDAKKINADLVIATDPDADRIGMAVKDDSGSFVLLNGNQTGSLLMYYVLSQLKAKSALPANGVVIKTIVTTELQRAIADAYGIECVDVLTGFKYIAEKIREYERQGTPEKPVKQFLCGGEESYGYLADTFVRDKDAVSTAALLAEIAAFALSKQTTVYGLLQDIYRRFGMYKEYLKSLTFKGKEGMETITKIMASLRSQPPRALANIKVNYISDYNNGTTIEPAKAQIIGTLDLPSSNVLAFSLQDNTRITIRPSGTEPKIKIYIGVQAQLDDKEPAKVEKQLVEKIEKLESDFLKIVDSIVKS